METAFRNYEENCPWWTLPIELVDGNYPKQKLLIEMLEGNCP